MSPLTATIADAKRLEVARGADGRALGLMVYDKRGRVVFSLNVLGAAPGPSQLRDPVELVTPHSAPLEGEFVSGA